MVDEGSGGHDAVGVHGRDVVDHDAVGLDRGDADHDCNGTEVDDHIPDVCWEVDEELSCDDFLVRLRGRDLLVAY